MPQSKAQVKHRARRGVREVLADGRLAFSADGAIAKHNGIEARVTGLDLRAELGLPTDANVVLGWSTLEQVSYASGLAIRVGPHAASVARNSLARFARKLGVALKEESWDNRGSVLAWSVASATGEQANKLLAWGRAYGCEVTEIAKAALGRGTGEYERLVHQWRKVKAQPSKVGNGRHSPESTVPRESADYCGSKPVYVP